MRNAGGRAPGTATLLLAVALLPAACVAGGGVGAAEEVAGPGPEARGAGESGPWPVSAVAGEEPSGAVPALAAVPAGPAAPPLLVAAGSYVPLYGEAGSRIAVAAFELDPLPVTVGDYLRFAAHHPEWRRGAVPPVFAGAGYLGSWRAPLDPGAAAPDQPVTDVSWFAARAYCAARGMRLPYLHEWEYAAAQAQAALAEDAATARRLALELQLQVRERGVRPAGSGVAGPGAVRDLHGGVAEWVEDFQSSAVSDDSRALGGQDRNLYCASGAAGATATDDYAAFLRYALRASLQGASTLGSLGFRCARSST
jgi:formylglycine-generating enzyme